MLSSTAAASWVQEQLRLHHEYLAAVRSRIGVTADTPLMRQLAAERATFEATMQEWDAKKALGETDPSRIACRPLQEDEVRFEPALGAKAVLAWVKSELNLGPLRIRWFAHLDAEDKREYRQHLRIHGAPAWQTWHTDAATPALGQYLTSEPEVLHIKASNDARQLVFVVAHEARHAWQQGIYGTPATRRDAYFNGDYVAEMAWSEADANDYAESTLAAFGHPVR